MTRILGTYLITLVSLVPITGTCQPLQDQEIGWDRSGPLLPHLMYEDQRGFIWTGIDDAVYRFDGHEFQRADLPEGVGTVTALVSSDSTRLLFGTDSGHLGELHGWTTDTFPNRVISSPIRGIVNTPNGELWVATYGEGILRLDSAGRELERFDQSSGFPNNFIYAALRDRKGHIWFSSDAGVHVFNPSSNRLVQRHYGMKDGLPDHIVPCLAEGPKGDLWAAGYQGGLSYFSPEEDRFVTVSSTESLSQIRHLNVGYRSIWVGTRRSGCWEYQTDTDHLEHHRALGRGEVLSLLLDEERNIWCSSRLDGLRKALSLLRFIPTSAPDRNQPIRSVVTTTDGNVWYSTEDGLFLLQENYQPAPSPRISPAEAGLPPIISMYADEDDRLWLGTFGGGLIFYDPDTEAQILFTEADGLTNGNILSVTGDGHSIWVGTLGGMSKLTLTSDNQIEVDQYTREDGMSDNYMYQVRVDHKHRLWIATDGQGLTTMRNGEFDILRERKGIRDRVIYSVTTDKNGITWALGQQGRVYRIEKGTGREVPSAYRSNRIQASGIVTASDQSLIITHRDGFDRYDPTTGLLISYGQDLRTEALSSDLNAFDTDPTGRVWMGTNQGLMVFSAPDPFARVAPSLMLNEATLFFQPAEDLFSQPLSANENHLTFSYVALWYQAPKAVSYRHRLSGYDLNWIVTSDRQVSYPKLGRGTYVFRAEAGLNNQFHSTFNQAFEILPPYYLIWWFWLLILLFVVGVMVVIVRVREQRLSLESRREKENIQYQFDLLRNQVNPHFLFNSFNTLISLIEQNQASAIQYVERLSDLFRNMLEYRKENVITLQDELGLLENYVFLQKQRYRTNLSIDVDIVPEHLPTFIPPLTLQMLVENAIKHNVISSKKPLRITVRSKDNSIEVMNPLQPRRKATPSTGMGLENIRQRYLLLSQGKVSTRKDEAQFIVSIPLIRTDRHEHPDH